jgi:hypothetical protein
MMVIILWIERWYDVLSLNASRIKIRSSNNMDMHYIICLKWYINGTIGAVMGWANILIPWDLACRFVDSNHGNKQQQSFFLVMTPRMTRLYSKLWPTLKLRLREDNICDHCPNNNRTNSISNSSWQCTMNGHPKWMISRSPSEWNRFWQTQYEVIVIEGNGGNMFIF